MTKNDFYFLLMIAHAGWPVAVLTNQLMTVKCPPGEMFTCNFLNFTYEYEGEGGIYYGSNRLSKLQ